MDECVKRFRKYLPYIRMLAGYSQQDVADVLKITRVTYNYIEGGKNWTMKDYYALRYIFEQVDQMDKILHYFVDRTYVSDEVRDELIRRFDTVIKAHGFRKGIKSLRNDLIKVYNEYVIESRKEKHQ